MSGKSQPREFIEVLKEMQGGSIHYDLTEGLANLIAAVMDTRKDGSMTLKIKVKPTGKSILMGHEIDVKEPTHDRPATTFFVGDGFTLHRDDPRQEKMEFERIDEPEEPVQQVPKDDDQPLRVVGDDNN